MARLHWAIASFVFSLEVRNLCLVSVYCFNGELHPSYRWL